MRALLDVPAGLAPRPIALHAPPGEAAHLVMRLEESHPAERAEDGDAGGILGGAGEDLLQQPGRAQLAGAAEARRRDGAALRGSPRGAEALRCP